MTFDEWLDTRGRSENTRTAYRRALQRFRDPEDPEEVAQYFTDHAADSPSTLQVVRAALRAYARYANSADPTAGLVVRRPKATLPRPMPMRDVKRLLGAVDATTPDGRRDRLMLELMLHGLRRHEVAGLTTEHVDLVGDPGDPEATVVLRFVGKGGYEGEVVLNQETALLLARHVATEYPLSRPAKSGEELEWLERICRLWDKPKPLFRTRHGAMTNREVNRIFVRHREAAGLSERWGPHSLRHTCGTELVEREVDIRVVQEVLRHKDIRMTMGYTKVSRGAKTRAAGRIPIPRGD